ncbi:MAG: hypothetical protein WAN90_02305 [Dysgonamonadaceae bacterium]|jgi:hypothetical protein
MMILHSGFFLTISEEFPLIRIEEKSTPKKIVSVVFDMRYLFGTVCVITRTNVARWPVPQPGSNISPRRNSSDMAKMLFLYLQGKKKKDGGVR